MGFDAVLLDRVAHLLIRKYMNLGLNLRAWPDTILRQTLHDPLKDRHKQTFRQLLLRWYNQHARDLPWRKDTDPYRVWLSEVMLQQTRVAAVIRHYAKFLERFPTVESLAKARESTVLAAWSGLGYYRRARMLHGAARKIVKEHGGKFPGSIEDLQRLPGIGRYTAAAVASIAFGTAVAAVDGNVERVLERVYGENLSGKELWTNAELLLEPARPGDFNQAIMELGATVCLPRRPLCASCPVVELCATRGAVRRTQKEVRHRKEIHYALDHRPNSVYLVQRSKHDRLMPGMWELPQTPSRNANGSSLRLRHSITSTDYIVRVTRQVAPKSEKGRWVERRRVLALPLTGLARKILRASGII